MWPTFVKGPVRGEQMFEVWHVWNFGDNWARVWRLMMRMVAVFLAGQQFCCWALLRHFPGERTHGVKKFRSSRRTAEHTGWQRAKVDRKPSKILSSHMWTVRTDRRQS